MKFKIFISFSSSNIHINITNISESEIIDLINVTEEITQILKPLYYGIIKTKYLNTQNGVVWSTPNHNLFNKYFICIKKLLRPGEGAKSVIFRYNC